MKLIDYLKSKGVEVPEKTKPTSIQEEWYMVDNAWKEGFNACHYQWANLEVPESKGLDREQLNKIKSEVEKDYGVDEYELRADNGDYTPSENERFLMEDFHEGFMSEFIDKLCSLQHTVKCEHVTKSQTSSSMYLCTICGEKYKPTVNWLTPPEIMGPLQQEFDFNFDPCPYPRPSDFEGLDAEWGERNYVNPPFASVIHNGKKKGPTAWVRKCI